MQIIIMILLQSSDNNDYLKSKYNVTSSSALTNNVQRILSTSPSFKTLAVRQKCLQTRNTRGTEHDTVDTTCSNN